MSSIDFFFGDECKIFVNFEHREPIFSVEIVYVHNDDSSYTFTLEGTPEFEGISAEGRQKSKAEVSNVWDGGQRPGLYRMQRIVFYNNVGGSFHDEPMATVDDYEWPSFELHHLANSAAIKGVRVSRNGESVWGED